MSKDAWYKASAALLMALGAGCASSPEPAAKEEIVEEVLEARAEGSMIDESSAPGRLAAWVIGAVNGPPEGRSAEAIAPRLAPVMAEALPPEQLSALLGQIHDQLAPLEPTAIEEQSADAIQVRVQTSQPGVELIVAVHVDGERMDGLFFRPPPRPAAELPQSWEAIEAEAASWGGEAEIYAARIDPESFECRMIHQSDLKPQALALGSAFKLYVLAELAAQVQGAARAWDEKVAIEQRRKSLPSGVMQNLEPGSEHALSEFATKMIEISDNTATDHLIALLGSRAIERRVVASGHASPERMRPFLSTRAMFALKLGEDKAARDRYVALGEEERRAYIAELEARPLPALEDAASGWTEPRHIDSIEWFASGRDLCRLHASFARNHEEPGWREALAMLARNTPGVKAGRVWAYVGYKGGSEPGVMAMSYLLRDLGGAWYSLTIASSGGSPQVGAALPELARAAVGVLARRDPVAEGGAGR